VIYFDNRTSNLINAVLVDPATFTYQAQNISEARIDAWSSTTPGSLATQV